MIKRSSFFKAQPKARILNESGQGMIEYILVITVTVIIIVGLMDKMYRPMGQFIESLMGTYVACLLETGELPPLGNNSDDGTECQFAFPFGAEGSETARNTNQANTQRRGGSQDESVNDKATNEVGGGSSTSSTQRRGSGSSPRRRVVGSASGSRGAFGADGDGQPRAGKQQIVASDSDGRRGGYFSESGGGGVRIIRQRQRYIAVTGDIEKGLKRERKKDEKEKVSKTQLEGGGGGTRTKKIAFAPPEKRAVADTEIKVGGWSFGVYIKYALIAMIIILLIVLVGGQVLQMSKNWERSE